MCKKVKYRSEEIALRKGMQLSQIWNNNNCRAYYCKKCHSWHLTTQLVGEKWFY